MATHKEQAEEQQAKLSVAEKLGKEEGPGSNTRTISIDLQQTLPCPRIRVQRAYYKRKVWVYDCCIVDSNNQKATCFIWDETQAKRGSDEILSCLNKWIEAHKLQEIGHLC